MIVWIVFGIIAVVVIGVSLYSLFRAEKPW